MLTMVDLSNHTGPVTVADLRGTALIAAKCTEYGPGITFADPDYGKWRAIAKTIGAAFMAYHYCHPGSSAAESWAFFYHYAALQPGDLYAADLEVSDGLGPARVAQWGSAFAHAGFGQFRAWPWAYSDRAFIEAGNLDGMASCPLWVAIPGARPVPHPAPLFPPFTKTIADQYQWGTPPLNIDRDMIYLATPADLALYAIPAQQPTAQQLATQDIGVIRRRLNQLAALIGGGRA